MSDPNGWRHAPVNRHDVVAIPIIWVALLLSLHFHAAMLWFWLPQLQHHLSVDDTEPGKARPVLVTRLSPITTPTIAPPPSLAPPPRAASPPLRRAPAPAAKVRPSPPPALTAPVVAPSVRRVEPPPPSTSPPVAAPSPAPQEADLASYIDARRRARGDPTTTAAQGNAPNTPPSETEAERLNRTVAANLAPSQQPTFGYDPKSGGGVFQLKRIGYDDAEFYFTGWNKDIGRRARQLIEVRKGSDSDVRQAVVRKMIAIIRDEVQGDFSWKSDRLGLWVVRSARPADNAALEEFLMQEFFSDPRPQR